MIKITPRPSVARPSRSRARRVDKCRRSAFPTHRHARILRCNVTCCRSARPESDVIRTRTHARSRRDRVRLIAHIFLHILRARARRGSRRGRSVKARVTRVIRKTRGPDPAVPPVAPVRARSTTCDRVTAPARGRRDGEKCCARDRARRARGGDHGACDDRGYVGTTRVI